eukprot:COSAG04_NODE_1808_length_5520_cov_1.952038_3_plen_69_part_00
MVVTPTTVLCVKGGGASRRFQTVIVWRSSNLGGLDGLHSSRTRSAVSTVNRAPPTVTVAAASASGSPG